MSFGASEKGGPTVDAANLNNPHPPHGLMLYLAPYVLGGSTGHWAHYGSLWSQQVGQLLVTKKVVALVALIFGSYSP